MPYLNLTLALAVTLTLALTRFQTKELAFALGITLPSYHPLTRFQTKELAFALGITLSVARFGSVLNNALSPWLAVRLGSVASALWVGVAVCGASLLCALALGTLDSHHSRVIRRRFKVEAAGAGEGPVACADVARFGRPFWLLAG